MQYDKHIVPQLSRGVWKSHLPLCGILFEINTGLAYLFHSQIQLPEPGKQLISTRFSIESNLDKILASVMDNIQSID